MKQISNDLQIEITDDKEIDVEIIFRCFLNECVALYPMHVSGSIYKGYSLNDFKKEAKESYEKDYSKVEIVKVYIED